LNEGHGTVNSPTGGYHETITRAYVKLLSEFSERCGDVPLAERVARLLRSPLAHKDVLLNFYSREVLMSVEARARWVQPDLASLEIEVVLAG
jgi:hypothetical protein